MTDLKRIAPKDFQSKLLLLGDYDPKEERIIKDPYWVNTM